MRASSVQTCMIDKMGGNVRRRADPLLDFKKTTVGFFSWLLWASRDALMGPLVVKSFKNRVALKDPSILPFLSSTMTISPVTDYLGNRLEKSTR
jgi:hypothetical protein